MEEGIESVEVCRWRLMKSAAMLQSVLARKPSEFDIQEAGDVQ